MSFKAHSQDAHKEIENVLKSIDNSIDPVILESSYFIIRVITQIHAKF